MTVRLYGVLRGWRPSTAEGEAHHEFEFDLNRGAKLGDLVEALQIPAGRLSAMAVNGQLAESSDRLNHGDRIRLFPPVAGGRPIG